MLYMYNFVAIYTFVKIQKQKVEKNVPCASCRPKTSIVPDLTPYDYTDGFVRTLVSSLIHLESM